MDIYLSLLCKAIIRCLDQRARAPEFAVVLEEVGAVGLGDAEAHEDYEGDGGEFTGFHQWAPHVKSAGLPIQFEPVAAFLRMVLLDLMSAPIMIVWPAALASRL